MKDDVRIYHEVVTTLLGQFGMLPVPISRQHRSKSRKLGAEVTVLEAARDVIADISFSQDCTSLQRTLQRQGKDRARLQVKTLPLTVFFRNLVCASGRSARERLRMVIGGCGFDGPGSSTMEEAIVMRRLRPERVCARGELWAINVRDELEHE